LSDDTTGSTTANNRDNPLWLACWRDRNIDFHQSAVNPLLVRFWPTLNLPAQASIFIPLCGKSLDLLWLAAQGHSVIGSELSPIAVRAFFRENRLEPTRRPVGALTLWEHGNIRILCGDFFRLTAADLGDIAAVYDRAALTALPEDVRPAYLAHLAKIVPADCLTLLLTTEEPEDGETEDQPFAVADEISSLYAATFAIELIHVESLFEADPAGDGHGEIRVEHKVYRLDPKAG